MAEPESSIPLNNIRMSIHNALVGEYEKNKKVVKIIHFHERSSSKWPVPKIVFASLYLVLLFYFANGLHGIKFEQIQAQTQVSPAVVDTATPLPQVLGTQTQKESVGFPVRLKVPKIKVDAVIEYVGLTAKGEMSAPNNTIDVGWFDLGPHPGEKGSAVIAGHLDKENGEPGIFSDLSQLEPGDELYIVDNNNKSITFTVTQIQSYDPGYADEVFSRSDGTYLNLVTCDGVWDEAQKSYSKRLVVFAKMTEE